MENASLLSFNTAQSFAECGIKNFEFIVGKQVQVNPDNLRASSVLKNWTYCKKTPKQWCNDSGVLNLHHGYYIMIMM